MMILSMRMSSDVILTSIRTLFPLLLRLSSQHVCLDANVRKMMTGQLRYNAVRWQ